MLRASIPTTHDYEELLQAEWFAAMEAYSRSFLERNDGHLRDYARRWVRDPLHQWSRQWEYPFVYSRAEPCARAADGKQVNILDAGSGITFFPYYLESQFAHCRVHCCDIDETLAAMYEAVNRTMGSTVSFSAAALLHTPYPDGQFDLIYCISVLEHTADYAQIIAQLDRVMKPGGKLIVTFDISLDGREEMPADQADGLLAALTAAFTADEPVDESVVALLSRSDIVTTAYANELNPDLIPWRRPSISKQIKAVLRGRGVIGYPPPYSVYCLSLTKRS